LMENDFSGTLDQLLQMPDGLALLSSNNDLSDASRQLLLSRFANLPQAWKDELGSRSYRLTSRMEPHEILAKDWVSIGLSAKQVGEVTGMALFSQTRRDESKAIEYYQQAQLAPAGAQQYLDILRSNGGREVIADLLPHLNEDDARYIRDKMGGEAKILNPPDRPQTAEALATRLTQLQPDRFFKLTYAMKKWNDAQKEKFQNDYAAMQGKERDRITAMLAVSGETYQRATALREAFQSPEVLTFAEWDQDRFERQVSETAVELLLDDADRATRWVKGLPLGNARTWAIRNVASNWQNYDPHQASQFLESFSKSELEAVPSGR
ncbi:MAG: hypothetical protein ACJAVK_002684, partial [Akkermansiaceae bacterium]